MVERKHRGAYSELIACAWLLKEGYEVFRNVSPHGAADLVAIGNGEVLRIDVKTGGVHPLQPAQAEQGIAAIYVLPNGDCVLERQPAVMFAPGPATCEGCGGPFTRAKATHHCCSQRCRAFANGMRRKAAGLSYPRWIDTKGLGRPANGAICPTLEAPCPASEALSRDSEP